MNETAIDKLTKAEQWLAEAKTLDDLKDIHDIAIAAEAYAKAHRLGLEAENHAKEIKFLAARRIGELVPASEHGGIGGGSKGEIRITNIAPPRLTEFRKLAEIPLSEFKERIEAVKAREERISYNTLLRGDWYQMSETSEWETPQWLFDKLNQEFHFDVDVCATEINHKCPFYYSPEQDGLKQSWQGICWMNPPYGKEIKDWLNKASLESRNGAKIVCLVPARTDTEWWWNNCINGEIRFIRGRVQFISGTAAPFPSAVVVLGKDIKSSVVWWEVSD